MRLVALDMLDRYAHSLADLRWLGAACVALVVLVLAAERWPRRPERRKLARGAVAALAVAGGLAWAWALRWLCDDAYISFRYAENLVRGHGLVFNVGERVEGYTNFLWTLLLAGMRALGTDIPQASIVLGLTCFAMLIALAVRVSKLALPGAERSALPLAAVLCAAQYTLASFGTSGLETMFGAMLVMLALERALSGAPAASGLAGVAAAMAHPDHGIFYAALGAALLLDADRRRQIVRYAVPFVAVYVPYYAWRILYYGEFFPNTYYAKSADQSYFEQGGVYIVGFLIGSGFLLALPVMAHGAWSLRRTLFGRFCLIAVPLFSFYVARVGGDFMYGRLMSPLIAPLLVLGEAGVRRQLAARNWVRATACVLLLSVVVLPTGILQPLEKRWHLSDERFFYRLESFDPIVVDSLYFRWAEALLEHFPSHREHPRLAMFCVGIIGYLTGWPLVDGFGLTDRVVAHTPITARGRPGHEKFAAPAYIASRDVDISDNATYPEQYHALTRIRIKDVELHLVRYDPRVLQPLRGRPGVAIPDYESYLDKLLGRHVERANADRTACDAWFAEQFYFSRVPESPQRARMRQQLLAAGAPPADVQPPAIDFRDAETHVPDASTRLSFDPSERARYTTAGNAFQVFPRFGAVLGQPALHGHDGALVDTFVEKLRERGVGRLRSKPFRLVGDVMELRVGGGPHSERLRVSLLVGDRRVFSTAGCRTEIMGRRLWQIAAYAGQDAVLEIVDESIGPWGHILVDEVVQWVPKPP